MTEDEALRLSELRRLTECGRARELRIAARLSLTEVGQACGVPYVSVSRWERNLRRPRGPGALRYAAFLAVLDRSEASRAVAS